MAAQPKMAAGEAGQPAQPQGDGQKKQPVENNLAPGDLVLPWTQESLTQNANPDNMQNPQQPPDTQEPDTATNVSAEEEKFLLGGTNRPDRDVMAGVNPAKPVPGPLPSDIYVWLQTLNELAAAPNADPSIIATRNALVRGIMRNG